MRVSHQTQFYFDVTIHIQKVKDCISGKNEEKCLEVLDSLHFKQNIDFVRQHPIGDKFVCDLAFIKEQIAIEIDGKTHLNKKQKRVDKIRDRFFNENNWVVIRIEEKRFFQHLSFFKHLIKEVVYERRKQYNQGRLYPTDIPEFRE